MFRILLVQIFFITFTLGVQAEQEESSQPNLDLSKIQNLADPIAPVQSEALEVQKYSEEDIQDIENFLITNTRDFLRKQSTQTIDFKKERVDELLEDIYNKSNISNGKEKNKNLMHLEHNNISPSQFIAITKQSLIVSNKFLFTFCKDTTVADDFLQKQKDFMNSLSQETFIETLKHIFKEELNILALDEPENQITEIPYHQTHLNTLYRGILIEKDIASTEQKKVLDNIVELMQKYQDSNEQIKKYCKTYSINISTGTVSYFILKSFIESNPKNWDSFKNYIAEKEYKLIEKNIDDANNMDSEYLDFNPKNYSNYLQVPYHKLVGRIIDEKSGIIISTDKPSDTVLMFEEFTTTDYRF